METMVKSSGDKFSFITDNIQRGRKMPKKYRHYITIPRNIYDELYEHGVIKPEIYYIDESAFFEFENDVVKINFISLFAIEDLHRKIDHYLINKLMGEYPFKRGGFFKI
jgi:hypothetical protein